MTNHAVLPAFPVPLRPSADMPSYWGDAELGFDAAADRIIEAHVRNGVRRDLAVPDLKSWVVAPHAGQLALVPLDRRHPPRPLRNNAFAHLMTRLRVPAEFLRRLPAPLQLAVANYALLVHEETAPATLRLRGEEITAIVSERYAPLDPIELMDTLRDTLKKLGLLQDIRVRGVASGLVDNLRLILPTETEALKPGDVSAVGLDVTNSSFGRAALHVSPVVWRLVCSNGLRRAERDGAQLSFRHVGDSSRLRDGLAEAIPAALSGARALMSHWQRSVSFMMDNVHERIMAMRELTVPEKENVKQALMLDLGESKVPGRVELYRVVNALTHSAKTGAPSRRLELEAAAGQLLVQHVGSRA